MTVFYNYYGLYYYYLLNVYVCTLLVLYYICTEWHVHLHTYVYVCGILFNIIIITQLNIATRIYPGLYINNAGK